MSTQKLTELPNILYEGIDYESVLARIQEIIENNPNWKDNWTSFYNSEAGSMLTQLMAWVADNLGVKQDLIYNEMFIGTAQDDDSKILHLNQIGYTPLMAKSARGKIEVEANTFSQTDVILTPRRGVDENISERVGNIFKFKGKNINGDETDFEVLKYVNGKPDYMSEVALLGGSTTFDIDVDGNTVYAYEGTSIYEEFYSDTSDGPVFEISNENIDDNTIRVYDITDNNIEFNNVPSFIDLEAKDITKPVPFVIEYTTSKKYRIRFASRGVMTYSGETHYDRLFPAGHTIGVMYRTTSGNLGNSPIGFLKATATAINRDGETIQITVNNTEACQGGSDQEKLKDAAINAPMSLRTMDRAVTPDDFDFILNRNTSILKIRTYTPSNQPNGFKSYFGRNINPQEAFAFVALKKNYENVPTSEYKNFPWITMNKEQVLNEEYCFDAGVFNKELSYSGMYSNYKVILSNGQIVPYENARVIQMPVDFCGQIGSGEVSGIAVKLSTEKNNEDFFANIPFSLEYDKNDTDYKHAMTCTSSESTAEESNRIFRRAVNKHATYISQQGFKEREPIDCTKAKIKIFLDEKTGVEIDLGGENNEHCWRFLSNRDHSSAIQGISNEAFAEANDGIVETINKKFANLYTTNKEYAAYDKNHSLQFVGLDFDSATVSAQETNKISGDKNEQISDGVSFIIGICGEVFSIYVPDDVAEASFDIWPDSNYARPGCFYKSVADIGTEHIRGEDLLETGNPMLYNSNGEPNYLMAMAKPLNVSKGSLEDIAYKITYCLNRADQENYIKIYDEVEDRFMPVRNAHDGQELIKKLKSIRLSVVQKFIFDENYEQTAANSYDIAFESLNANPLDNSALVIDFEPNIVNVGALNKAKKYFGATDIPEVQKAADYSSIASYVTVGKEVYLKIESPLVGSASTLYFEKPNKQSKDILETVFKLPYTGTTSDKAIGVRKLDLYLDDTAGAMYGKNFVASDAPKAGYFVLQDNMINSLARYSNIYANYKLEFIDSLELGSIYNNFYLTGNQTIDDENKPEIISLDGQSVVAYTDNGVTRYKLDEAKSNFDVRFTKRQQDTNSLASIKTDLDIIKADLIKLPTMQLTRNPSDNTPCPSRFIFSVDNYDAMEINIGEKYLTIGEIDAESFRKIIYEAITNTGASAINIANINTAIKENVYNIINYSYKYQNQLEIGNFTKDSESNITFYHCPGAEYEHEKALYEKIFGTKYTNPELFELHAEELAAFETEDGGFCPREANALNEVRLTYKKKVEDKSGNVEIRSPDYYIEIASSNGSDGNIKYKFYLKKTVDSRFPDVPFYVHFVNDRTYALDSAGNKVEYDEDILQQYMYKYKIAGTDIYFLKPYFRTFDVAATIHYNANFNLSNIRQDVENAIQNIFSLDKAEIGKSVSKSKIIKTIMNCVGVESVNIEYFGYDYTDQETYENQVFEIPAEFYEILFLHEDEDNEHGKIFNYVQYNE